MPLHGVNDDVAAAVLSYGASKESGTLSRRGQCHLIRLGYRLYLCAPITPSRFLMHGQQLLIQSLRRLEVVVHKFITLVHRAAHVQDSEKVEDEFALLRVSKCRGMLRVFVQEHVKQQIIYFYATNSIVHALADVPIVRDEPLAPNAFEEAHVKNSARQLPELQILSLCAGKYRLQPQKGNRAEDNCQECRAAIHGSGSLYYRGERRGE